MEECTHWLLGYSWLGRSVVTLVLYTVRWIWQLQAKIKPFQNSNPITESCFEIVSVINPVRDVGIILAIHL